MSDCMCIFRALVWQPMVADPNSFEGQLERMVCRCEFMRQRTLEQQGEEVALRPSL